jgi:hypothetical protein
LTIFTPLDRFSEGAAAFLFAGPCFLGFGEASISSGIHLLHLHRLPDMGIWAVHVTIPRGFRLLYICNDLPSEALWYSLLMVRLQSILWWQTFCSYTSRWRFTRNEKPHRFNDSARLPMLLLAKLFDWKNTLVNVKPETFIGWHNKAFQLLLALKVGEAEDHGCRRTFGD